MPAEDHGLNPRQAKFCEEYIKDHNASRAAREAGYSVNSCAEIGSQNLRKLQIKAYITELEDNVADQLGITPYWLLEMQRKVIEAAFEEEQFPSSNKGLETLMRHRGMLTDRQEITQHVEYVLDIGDLDDGEDAEDEEVDEPVIDEPDDDN